MPLLGLMYLIAYVDRQNVSFAKLQMLDDLRMSESAYGLGASLFFIGYFLFEVPSNLILGRVGARRWFARIMFTWGLVTVALAYTTGPVMFYILRFLLGACEAGFFPGVLYLLTVWVPFGYRARMVGWFMIASAVAKAVGAPICGSLLDLDGTLGLHGWQWVFLATGIPAVLMGVVTLFILPDDPEHARFYNTAQKTWLRDTIAAENRRAGKVEHGNPLKALADGRVLLLALTFVGFPLAAYGLIPDALSNDCFGPGALGDGSEALWRAHQLVPGIAAGTHDGVVAVPNAVAEKVGAQISPDLFHRVQFRRIGWQRQQADVFRHL